MDAVEIGKRVRAARGYADLSQPDLAAKVQISKNTLSRTESGLRKPKDGELVAIANVCGVGLAFFDYDFAANGVDAPGRTDQLEERLAKVENVTKMVERDLAPLAGLDAAALERLVAAAAQTPPDRKTRTQTRRRRAG